MTAKLPLKNAWGYDEDIYNKMIPLADSYHNKNNLFFNFIMTTSNHRPYTYPENKIDIPSGTGEEMEQLNILIYALKQMLKRHKQAMV